MALEFLSWRPCECFEMFEICIMCGGSRVSKKKKSMIKNIGGGGGRETSVIASKEITHKFILL